MAVEWLSSGFTGTTTSYSGSENNDGGTGLTLGTWFCPVKAGYITQIRFWKTSIDDATSRGVAIYNFAGTVLASATTSGEPVGTAQWITVTLPTPLAVSNATALTVNYIVAVYYPQQRYPATNAVFAGSGTPNGQSKYSSPNAALYSPGDNEAGLNNNGLFHYGSGITKPDGSFGSGWYWVDVGWEPASGGVSVNVTGTSGTGSTGTLVATGKANVSPTGTAGTTAVGTVTTKANAGVSPNGSAATGSVGDVSIVGKANVSPTGNVATTALGSAAVSVAGGTNVSPTGNAGTGATGTVTVNTASNVSVSPTGNAGTGAVGTVTAYPVANVSTTGVSATGSVGTVSITSQTGAIVNATGVSTTGFVGDVTIVSVNNIPAFPTGVSGTVDIGTVAAGPVIPVTIAFQGWGSSYWSDQSWGNINFLLGQMNASVGNPLIQTKVAINVTGVAGAGAVGNVQVIGGNTTVALVTGVQSNTAIGVVDFITVNRITVTGIAQPAVVGNVNILLSQNVSVTGVEGFGLTQLVSTRNYTNLEIPTGVGGTLSMGTVDVQAWQVIPDASTIWTPVDETTTNPWTAVATPSNNWTPVR